MGLLKKLFQPMINNINGKKGEDKVRRKLNPIFLGAVEHREIDNLIIVDENGKSHQIDHIEIRENGIFCIETKNYKGWIFGSENQEKWTQTLYNGEKHQFLNPLKQNKSHIYHLSKILNNEYKINSVIVMVQNNASRIQCDNVLNLDDLRRYLKRFDNGIRLTTEEMDKIYYRIRVAGSDMKTKEHISNIRITERELHEKGICPRCGGQLVLRYGKYGSFWGCSNFPTCRFKIKDL